MKFEHFWWITLSLVIIFCCYVISTRRSVSPCSFKTFLINTTMVIAMVFCGQFFIIWDFHKKIKMTQTQLFQTQYDAYKKANRMFLDVIIENYEEGDIVWCHDYHLMFLPQYLKEHNNKIKVGWFLHSPFPSSEVYKTLPSRSELLRSILTADLIG